jgi:undecaprenyl phosphate-alpha-L-ara4N flippase subunit ArnE
MVAMCTILLASAQIFIKGGAAAVHGQGMALLIAIATNWKVVTGFALLGLSTVVMVLALRHGELSILYPIIALTYVWVAILSMVIFHEQMTWNRAIGISLIVAGVGVLGRGNRV